MKATGTVDYLGGIIMRAKGAVATRDFYVKSWGLTAVAQQDGAVYFRGTGPEYYIYGLREDDVFGVDVINFGVASRAGIDSLHGRLTALGVVDTYEHYVLQPPVLILDGSSCILDNAGVARDVDCPTLVFRRLKELRARGRLPKRGGVGTQSAIL